MTLGLLEDVTLYELAGQVVPEAGSGVDNAQISGLLSTARASRSYSAVRKMTLHQLEKARKEGDRSEDRAAFYKRLFEALQQVEKHADAYGRSISSADLGKAEARRLREQWSGRLALTLMTHVAAEHRFRGSR